MPKITVDGKTIDCKDRQMIIQACLDAGMVIPRYCYHPGLSIPASCRICLVEVEGIPKLVPSCQTPVRDGMVVHTQSSKAIANQKQVMEYLLLSHPLDCHVCDQAGECFLQDYSFGYGRAVSRFEEPKHKRPKKDVGKHTLLYNDRCIMCTRCVRFTREVSGESELYVDGRGYKEEIDIFPGKPLDNKLSGNVVDLCPVGALLDKSFLFKQRVWLLKSVPSISPIDSGGENIWIDQNEGRIYRIKPRYNADVNTWWISDDTRHGWAFVYDQNRIKTARRMQYGTQVDTELTTAVEQARTDLKALAAGAPGSLYAVLSPMMACEEAWLAGQAIRSLDPQAVLVPGPLPTSGADEMFKNSLTGKQTFVIKAEKAPNAAGVQRVIAMLGGPTASWADLVASATPELKKLKGGWIVGGYPAAGWLPKEQPALFKRGYRVVQDILPSTLSATADLLIPAAAWAEKDGCWENYQGRIQPFAGAVEPPEGVRREGDVYLAILGRTETYDARAIRVEMGEPFAAIETPRFRPEDTPVPEIEFAEL